MDYISCNESRNTFTIRLTGPEYQAMYFALAHSFENNDGKLKGIAGAMISHMDSNGWGIELRED